MVNNVFLSMIQYFGSDAKRINHALKVYGFATTLLVSENITGKTKDCIDYAAILHDIGIHEAERKYNSTSGTYQEIEGPAIAAKILKECGISDEIIDRVCFLIGNHHSYQKIDGIDFQILVEADFLVNIYEDEMKKSSIESIRNNYFKTTTGKRIIDSLYLGV